MKKISRRLFLFLFLSASSALYFKMHSGPATPISMLDLPPTPEGQPAVLPSPSPIVDYALSDATVVPINVVLFNSNADCLTPIIAPVEPTVIPPEGGIDETTGRHMMGDVQVLDLQSYRLAVTGLVDHPLSLTYDDLRCMPKMTETVTTTCYAFADTATWSGVLIQAVLKRAGVQPGATKMTQTAADGAIRTVPLEMAMDPHNFLAYQMGNKPLPILFGFPVRSIFVDVAGQFSVKWLTSLEVT